MASEQYVRNEQVEMNCEEETTLNELIKEAESQFSDECTMKEAFCVVANNETEEEEKDDIQANGIKAITTVSGAMKNFTKGGMNLHAQMKWAGHYVKSPPKHFSNVGAFMQSAIAKKGCEAAVVYAGNNKDGKPCGWLLAWQNTKAHGRKVYVDCGPITKFNNINWPQVKRNLERSGNTASHTDSSTGTKAFAKVVGSTGQAALASTFSG